MSIVELAVLIEERDKLEAEIRKEGKGAYSITKPMLEKLGRLNTKINSLSERLKAVPSALDSF